MSNQIPGVPEGWELVHAMRHAIAGEHYIGSDGVARKCLREQESMYAYPIIRKIEKPAKYRPFENAEEFKPHRDRWVRLKSIELSFYRLDGFGDGGVSIQGGAVDYGKMFEDHWFDDGTPFGVRIDE